MQSRVLWIAVASAAGLIAGIALLIVSDDTFGWLETGEDFGAYVVIFLLIFGDAVVPILPGETVLNTASVMAADGRLELPAVILAGALGAIIGDSALYWIARKSAPRVEDKVAAIERNARVQTVLRILGDRAPLFIVFGRYVPGLRFFVNATMGLQKMPYKSFLLWSAIGGSVWAAYTCLLAYAVGSALDDYPVASILASGFVTTVIIGLIFWYDARSRRDSAVSTP